MAPPPVRANTPAAYLISERDVAASPAQGYAYAVRPFLRKREGPDGRLRLEDLAPRDITHHLLTFDSPSLTLKMRVPKVQVCPSAPEFGHYSPDSITEATGPPL